MEMYRFRMNKQKGFSLVELIIVLAIWLLILTLSVPLIAKDINKIKAMNHLNVFQSDVMYAQSLAMKAQNKIRIIFTSNSYSIMENQKRLIHKTFPSNWSVEASLMKNVIDFDFTGRIQNPGTINIKTPHSQFSIVFPFGKARGYIVER